MSDAPATQTGDESGIDNNSRASDTNPARPDTTLSAGTETIGGYPVHPAAQLFPLLEGDEFETLVESIQRNGQRDPVVLHNGVLLEGRNRLHAVLALTERGHDIVLRTDEWSPRPGESAAQFIADKNLHRRHLTDDQKMQIALDLLPMIERETEAAQKASRIQPGEVRNPTGGKSVKANAESPTPAEQSAHNKAKAARSKVGKLAALTQQTPYKAARAIRIQKHASPEEIEAVRSGKKTAKEVAKKIEAQPTPAQGKKPKAIDHPFTPTTPLQHDLLAGWVRLRDSKVAINERTQAVADMRAILDAEEGASQSPMASSVGAAAKPNRQSARGKGGTK